MLVQYCIYSRDLTVQHLTDLKQLQVQINPHANRTRFWLDLDQAQHSLFLIKYSELVYAV